MHALRGCRRPDRIGLERIDTGDSRILAVLWYRSWKLCHWYHRNESLPWHQYMRCVLSIETEFSENVDDETYMTNTFNTFRESRAQGPIYSHQSATISESTITSTRKSNTSWYSKRDDHPWGPDGVNVAVFEEATGEISGPLLLPIICHPPSAVSMSQ